MIATQVSSLRTHHFGPSRLPRPAFEGLRKALLESPLVGRSTLAGPFLSSRGFAVIFHSEGIRDVLERFPQLEGHFANVLGAPSVEQLRPWYRAKRPAPNAWYLNVLLVTPGATVERHIDATLRPFLAEEMLPTLVSVLYLQVPTSIGGELQLWSDRTPVARIQPKENRVLHFRGDLAHQVEAFEGAPDAVRASLVIEQYTVTDEQLKKVPAFKLDSRAGFEAYLEMQRQRPVKKTFEIEP